MCKELKFLIATGLIWFVLITTITVQAQTEADPVDPDQPPAGCGTATAPSIVYTRQPRWDTPWGDPATGNYVEEAANWQSTSGVARVHGLFAESDIVLDDLNGNIEVIENCTTDPIRGCTAMEARVSPDAKTILYSLCTGTLRNMKVWGGPWTEHGELYCDQASLISYDIATKEKKVLTTGFRDRMPTFYDNEQIFFVSDRAGKYAPLGKAGNYYPDKAMKLYKGRIDGGTLADIKLITPHESYVLSPLVLADGRVCYSSWWGFLPNQPGTARNFWPVMCLDAETGANPVAELAAHGTPHILKNQYISDWVNPARQTQSLTEARATRFLAELSTGNLAINNYYRGNSTGACGVVFGWSSGIAGEGILRLTENLEAMQYGSKDTIGSGRFLPSDLRVLTPYGNDQDDLPNFHQDGRAAGRACQAAPWPIGQDWMVTHLRGWGYFAANIELANRTAMGGEPTMHKTIKLVHQDKLTNPFSEEQSTCLVCDEAFNAYDPAPVSTYQQLYGQALPTKLPPLPVDDTCELRVVDARAGEIYEIPGAPASYKVTYQGDGDASLNDKIRVQEVTMWDTVPLREGWKAVTGLSWGHVWPDGSVKVEVPCETPILISGIHIGTDGNSVSASDTQPMSLAKGEKRTCHGCHDGHSETRAAELGSAVERFKTTTAATK